MAQKERLVKERLETDVWQTSGGRRLGQTSGVTSQPKTKENSVGKGVNREWGQRLNLTPPEEKPRVSQTSGQTSGVTSQPKTKENSVGKGVNREWGQRLNCKRVAECLLTASGRDGVGFSRDVEAEVLRQLCSLG
jgi:hypothetical protein